MLTDPIGRLPTTILCGEMGGYEAVQGIILITIIREYDKLPIYAFKQSIKNGSILFEERKLQLWPAVSPTGSSSS